MLSNDEVACVYSALILQDDEIAVTAEKINTILKAAGVEVEPYWPTLFAKALEGVDIKQLITSVSAGVGGMGGGAGAGPGAPAAEAPAAKEEPKKEEKKEESEESDEDMGFGLFD